MVPTIGIMIGAYIILRCAEIMLKPNEHFAPGAGRPIVILLAVAVSLLTAASIYDLSSAGTRGMTQMESLQKMLGK